MIRNSLKNSKEIDVDNAIINNLTVNNTVNGSFNLSPTNIESSPVGQVTVDKYSKLIPVIGSILDSNTSGQVINASKLFDAGLKINSGGSGYLALRNDTTDTLFVHNLKYLYENNTSFDVFISSSDDSNIMTGLSVGYHINNNRNNGTNSKFNVRYLSGLDTTQINVEGKRFLTSSNPSTTNNNFDLTNISALSIGSNLTNQASLYIKKVANAELKLESDNANSKINIQGNSNSEIQVGNMLRINTTSNEPDLINFLRDSTNKFMNYNVSSGCLSIGPNISGAGQPYNVLNLSINNRCLKLPYMTNSEEQTFINSGLTGQLYSGSLFFLRDKNRLAFVDHQNVIHYISGTSIQGGLEVNNIANDSLVGYIQVPNGSNNNNITNLPLTGNVNLENLVGVSSNVQTQLNDRVTVSTDQTIMGKKVFSQSVNNSNNISLFNPIGNINGLEIVNNFSPNDVRILKNNDDLTFVIAATERARLTGNNFNLSNGGRYQINGTDIANVSETLTNKTIQYSANTPIGFCSTTTDQTLSGHKTFTHGEMTFANITESKISYSGISNYSIKMNTDGYNFYNETAANSLFKIGNTDLKYKDNTFNTAKINTTNSSPGVNNDNTQGYSVNSVWYNSLRKSRFVCTDASTGGAKWLNHNERHIYHSPTTSTVINQLTSYVYIIASNYFYTTASFIYSTDGTMDIQVYNVSTASVIATSSVVGPGIDILNLALGTALNYAPDQTLRFSFTLRSGTYASVLATSTS